MRKPRLLDLKAIWPLTIASVKMYFRSFVAVFFTFVFPIIFLLVFGFINSANTLTLDVAYFNEEKTQASEQFDDAFSNLVIDEEVDRDEQDSSRIFRIDDEVEGIDEAKEKLSDGDLNAVVVIPDDFSLKDGGNVELFIDEGNATFGDVTKSTISSILNEFNGQANVSEFGREPIEPFTVTTEGVQSNDLQAIDYLVPGIIAFSILSLGLFSITEGFVQLKTNGSLRRLHVAPIKPASFLIAQALTRLLMTIINVITMIVIAVFLFDFNLKGDIFSFLFVSAFGALMFIGFGYAIAGWAKDSNQAAPISNIVFFPMMFLSGTFFPREAFPDWLQPVTDFMPLTYVADAMRMIANDGVSLLGVGPELLGMFVWTIVAYTLAVKLFRWE